MSKDSASAPRRKPEAEGLVPGLYLVATPIGNLEDITLRALSTLRGADIIACEDTRVSLKLMNAYEIKTPLLAYHDHNAAAMRPKLLARLKRGEAMALISDAGTPLLSDPGYKLVEACIEEDIAVTAIPGASALLAGLSLAGLPMERFFYAGFLPPKDSARKAVLREFASIPSTLVFYEAPSRLGDSLAAMQAMLGNRAAAVARELTKKFEEVRRGDLEQLAAYYAEHAVKGEVVIVVGPRQETAAEEDDLDAVLTEAIAATSVKEAVAKISAARGLPRRTVYARALALTAKR